MANRDQLRIGIVGSGFMARTYSECLARWNEHARPVAVAGGKRAPKQAADYNLEYIPDVPDLISRADVDATTGKGWERIFGQPPLDPMNPSDPVRLEAYINMVQEFIDASLENRTPSVTGADGKAAVELCQAALQSSAEHQPVPLPLNS